MPIVPLFSGSTGLNTRVDPVRLKYNPDTGVQDLASAVNVDIDESARVKRRSGYTELNAYDSHSLWSDGRQAFFMSGGSLYRLNTDYSRTGIRSGMTEGVRVSFVSVGDDVYYANGFENGVIRDGVSYAWEGEDYVGPDTVYSISTTPPLGHLLAIMSGYMLIASESTIYFSWPSAFSWYRLSSDFVSFDGKISMMVPVEDGVWVSDSVATYFLTGIEPTKWSRVKKAGYPVVPYTGCTVNSMVMGEKSNWVGAVWCSTEGICIGYPGGNMVNLTYKKISLPSCSFGAGIVVGDRYIMTMEQ